MDINIAVKLRPYSHRPSSRCLIPGTSLIAEVFPTLLRLYRGDIENPELIAELSLQLAGPLTHFTLQQDLEAGQLLVWGLLASQPIRYAIRPTVDGFGAYIAMLRCPKEGIAWQCRSPLGAMLYHAEPLLPLDGPIEQKQLLILRWQHGSDEPYRPKPCERLSLGCHKAQDWDLLQRRVLPEEFLPFWHRSGMLLQARHSDKDKELHDWGSASLLRRCESAMANGDGSQALALLQEFFLAGFDSWLIPRLIDTAFQGLKLPPKPESFAQKCDPIALLPWGAKIISGLFIQQREGQLEILPALPPQLHCGRLMHRQCGSKGVLDLEWSKRLPRRARFVSFADQEIEFAFPSAIKTFRLRTSLQDSGHTCTAPAPQTLNEGQIYFLDRFQK